MIQILQTAIVAGSVIWCVMLILKMIESHFISKSHLETFTELSHALQKQIKADQETIAKAYEEKVTNLASRMDALLMHIKMSE